MDIINFDVSFVRDLSDLLSPIPSSSPYNTKVMMFVGVIDILQSYTLAKKLEHKVYPTLVYPI